MLLLLSPLVACSVVPRTSRSPFAWVGGSPAGLLSAPLHPPGSGRGLWRCRFRSLPTSATKTFATWREDEERRRAPEGLQIGSVPQHVAIIMDGNSRWAQERRLPVAAGHEAGVRALREVVNLSCAWGIPTLTLFAFSLDNWSRPQVEVNILMRLFESALRNELDTFKREGIRLCVVGDTSKLPDALQKLVAEVMETTKANSRLKLVVAVSYSGRNDIVQACKKIACKVSDGELGLADITESVFGRELDVSCERGYPDPDLVIRTSGEQRLSNFFLWQLAYSELFFTKTFWPDFGEAEYKEALLSYQRRVRRFGRRDDETGSTRSIEQNEEPTGVARESFG